MTEKLPPVNPYHPIATELSGVPYRRPKKVTQAQLDAERAIEDDPRRVCQSIGGTWIAPVINDDGE